MGKPCSWTEEGLPTRWVCHVPARGGGICGARSPAGTGSCAGHTEVYKGLVARNKPGGEGSVSGRSGRRRTGGSGPNIDEKESA